MTRERSEADHAAYEDLIRRVRALGYPTPKFWAPRDGWEPDGCGVCGGEMALVEGGPEFTVWECSDAANAMDDEYDTEASRHKDRSEVVCLHRGDFHAAASARIEATE